MMIQATPSSQRPHLSSVTTTTHQHHLFHVAYLVFDALSVGTMPTANVLTMGPELRAWLSKIIAGTMAP